MKTSLFNYSLPKNLIANSPAAKRDLSRLIIIDRKTGKISHHKFFEIEKYLGNNDVLVLNKTKVFPARIFAKKATGGKIEILFIEEIKEKVWTALVHTGGKIGTKILFKDYSFGIVGKKEQMVLIDTNLDKTGMFNMLKKYGKTPLPPYIKSDEEESDLRKKYQTVYAEETGSVAAPTAGFHFTSDLLKRLEAKGVQIEYVTLHVGLGTFAPVKVKEIEDHPMHSEEFFVDKNTAARLNKAKMDGKRIIAVGTTSTRVLETLAASAKTGSLQMFPRNGKTKIFIFPPYQFKFVDALVTNFHLPESTLLTLVSAFVSYPNTKSKFKNFKTLLIGKAYEEAVKEKYRFYSFGDACFIL